MERPPPERHPNDVRSTTGDLLHAYHKRGDIAARQRLVELYVPLVESFARRYARSPDDYDDIHQVGCIGLINAIDRFDLERGDELTAFAVPSIAGEIRRYLRDQGPSVKLPRRVLELRAPAAQAQADLASELGRAPSMSAIARKLGAAEEDVALALDAARAATPLALLQEGGADAPHGLEPLDTADDRVLLSDAFRRLDERERRILFLRYVHDLHPNDIARQLGMSRRHLSRTTQAALARLRAELEGAESPRAQPADTRPAVQRTAAESKLAVNAMNRLPNPEGYLDQPYHIELVRDEAPGGGWTAKVEELRGCAAYGATASDAVRSVEAAMREWIAEAQANDREVPKPRGAGSHSGRLLVRMPKSLHAELARAAEHDETSLNQFITGALASAVGWRNDERAGRGAGAATDEPATDNPSAGSRHGLSRAALVANLIVLAVVAAAAVILTVIAISGGG